MKRDFLRALVCLVFILAFTVCSCSVNRNVASDRLAVLGAFDEEVGLLEGMLVERTSQEIEGITFVCGRLEGRQVVLAWTGVGKVNAAMVTTLLIEHFQPAHVVFTGIAGAVDPNLEPGDIVIAKRVAHHDMGILWPEGLEPGGVRNRLTGDDNPVYFPADPNLMAAAGRAAERTAFEPVARKTGVRPPHVVAGTVVTGDAFVASRDKCAELKDKLGADAVEMEGAAVAQVCYQRGIGCLVIRSIADKADDSAVIDKQTFYDVAAANSARLVVEIARDPLM